MHSKQDDFSDLIFTLTISETVHFFYHLHFYFFLDFYTFSTPDLWKAPT